MGDVALQMNASMHTFQMHSFGAQIQPEHGPLVICSGTNQQKAEAVKVVDTDIPSMQFNGLWRERWDNPDFYLVVQEDRTGAA